MYHVPVYECLCRSSRRRLNLSSSSCYYQYVIYSSSNAVDIASVRTAALQQSMIIEFGYARSVHGGWPGTGTSTNAVLDSIEAGTRRGGHQNRFVAAKPFLLLLFLLLRRSALREVDIEMELQINLGISLRMLAGGSSLDVGARFGISHSSIYPIMWEVVDAMNNTPEFGPFFFLQKVARGPKACHEMHGEVTYGARQQHFAAEAV